MASSKEKLAHGRQGNKSSSIVRFWMCSNGGSELCDGLTFSVDTETTDTAERSVRKRKRRGEKKLHNCFFETSG